MVESVTPPNPADEGGSRPVPDPTVLTTDALRREIAGLEKLIDTKLEYSEELSHQRFKSIQHQLDSADAQRLEQKADTKAAVDAALAAQKEAITKTESSTAAQIASLNQTLDTKVEGLAGGISDLKDRVTIVESVKLGANEQRVENRAVTGTQVAAVGLVITIIVVILNVVLFLLANSPDM